MVVDDVGQMVGGHAVGLEKHLVVEQTAVHGDVATNEVVDGDVNVFGKFEAHYEGLSAFNAALHLVGGKGEAVLHGAACGAVVLEGFLLGFVFFAFGIESFGFVKGIVCPAVAKQLVGILTVEGFAVALAVGAVVASEVYTLVELDVEPVEGFDNVVFGTGHETGLVGVFDAENHVTAVLAGEEVIV